MKEELIRQIEEIKDDKVIRFLLRFVKTFRAKWHC